MQTEPKKLKAGDHSPWGPVETATEIAPDVWSVSTMGHGGILLFGARANTARALAGRWKGWNGDPAILEEDVDWAYAVLLWPGLFNAAACLAALETLSHRGVDGANYFAGLEERLPTKFANLRLKAKFVKPGAAAMLQRDEWNAQEIQPA